MYENVISSNRAIGDLRGAWNAIWEKYDSKKPATQSQLATKFSNCFHMPNEIVEQFINRLNDICACMVTDPGEAKKRLKSSRATNLLHIEGRRDMSWAEYCTSIKEEAW